MAASRLMQAIDEIDVHTTARILDSQPSEVSLRDQDDRTALHYAAECLEPDMVGKIIDKDASLLDAQDKNGHTPLTMAVMCGRTGVAGLLLQRGARADHIDKDGHCAVHWAVVCGQLDTLLYLLDRGADVNIPDQQNATPLHYATACDEIPHDVAISILLTLIRKGATVNCRDVDERTPIHWAASNGNVEALLSLKEAGGNIQCVDRDRLAPLHCAASHGFHAVIEVLLENLPRSQVDAIDRAGHTALFYAVTYGHYEAARLLLTRGANPNHQDLRLRTPSHCAAAKGQLRMLKLLKQFGGTFEFQNYRGDLPVHEAVQAGCKDVVEWLLTLHPSSLDVANHEGRTGLHLAAATGNIEMVMFLCGLKCHVDPLMLYKNTLYTPLDLAKRKRHEVVVDYLTMRHKAHAASELSESVREDAKRSHEERITAAKRYMERDNSVTAVGSRKRMGGAVHSQDVQTAATDAMPKSTSTSDLRGGESRDSSRRKRDEEKGKRDQDKVEERIERIVQEAIDRANDKNAKEDDTAHQSSSEDSEDERQREREKRREDRRKNRQKAEDEVEREDIQRERLQQIHPITAAAELSVTEYSSDDSQKNLSELSGISDTSEPEEEEEGKKRTVQKENQPIDNRLSPHKRNTRVVSGKHKRAATNGNAGKRSVSIKERKKKEGTKGGEGEETDVANAYGKVIMRVKREPEVGEDKGILEIYEDDWQPVDGADGKHPRHYVHEKAIFQELTHLKRMQIQYGKKCDGQVQERVLVRSLVGNFCKLHGLDQADFKFQTFYSWEKFLYDTLSDQLKMIYMEERERLVKARTGRDRYQGRFDYRLRQARPVPLTRTQVSTRASTVSSATPWR